MRNRWLLGTIVLACLVMTVSCGGGDDTPPQQEPRPTPTAQATEVPLTMDDIVWATGIDEASGEPLDEVSAYTTVSPAIVAVVPAGNVPAGTEFTATWTIDGLEVPQATMTATVEQDMQSAWVAFEFLRDEGRYFPLGVLEITVTASTGESVQSSIDIELP